MPLVEPVTSATLPDRLRVFSASGRKFLTESSESSCNMIGPFRRPLLATTSRSVAAELSIVVSKASEFGCDLV
jgi:hypothetical protein